MKKLSIEEFVTGTLVEFPNGEIWEVVGTNIFEAVLMKPQNEIAVYEGGIGTYLFNIRYIMKNAQRVVFNVKNKASWKSKLNLKKQAS